MTLIAKEHQDAIDDLKHRLELATAQDGMVILTQAQAERLMLELLRVHKASTKSEHDRQAHASARMAMDAAQRFIRYGTRGQAEPGPLELTQPVVLQALEEAIRRLA